MRVMVMKKLVLMSLLMSDLVAQAGPHRLFGPRFYGTPGISFYWGGYPYGGYSYYSPWSAYPYYPSYGYDYVYSRPNYVVNDTLTGALLGGIIGSGIHHQGWQGAGIGAAAGLVVGGLAELSARAYERNNYPTSNGYYSQPNSVSNIRSVDSAPIVPTSSGYESSVTTYRPASLMSGANALFGR
jgi:hypothetical protein